MIVRDWLHRLRIYRRVRELERFGAELDGRLFAATERADAQEAAIRKIQESATTIGQSIANTIADLEVLNGHIAACEGCGALYSPRRLYAVESKDGSNVAHLCGTCKHVCRVTNRTK
jgi:hypothetical protein